MYWFAGGFVFGRDWVHNEDEGFEAPQDFLGNSTSSNMQPVTPITAYLDPTIMHLVPLITAYLDSTIMHPVTLITAYLLPTVMHPVTLITAYLDSTRSSCRLIDLCVCRNLLY